MFGSIVQAMGYGFAAGTSPGPFQSYIISSTLAYGWRRSLIIVTSPLITDIPIIYLMAFVLLENLPADVIRGIQIAGGLYVLWLAWQTWKNLNAGMLIGAGAAKVEISQRRTLGQAIIMNLLSPGPYVFWGAVTGPLLREALDRSVLDAAVFLITYYGTFITILAAWVFVFDRVRRLDESITRRILLLTIGVLAALGLLLIYQGITGTGI